MEARGWGEEETVDLLEANWRRFREAGEVVPRKERRGRGGKKEKRKQANREAREKAEAGGRVEGEEAGGLGET